MLPIKNSLDVRHKSSYATSNPDFENAFTCANSITEYYIFDLTDVFSNLITI